MKDSRRIAERIVIRLNRHGWGLSNAAIGHVMEVLEMNGTDEAKNASAKDDVLPLFNAGDKIDIGTGFDCDKGIFIRYEDNKIVWQSQLGGEYKTPINGKIKKQITPN